MHPDTRHKFGPETTPALEHDNSSKAGFYIFAAYTISFFLSLPERFPFLGTIRIDFVLAIILLALAAFDYTKQKNKYSGTEARTTKLLLAIFLYIFLTIPFTEWPGSVVKVGLPDFFKATVFYIFIVSFVNNKTLLKKYAVLCTALLLITIIEPLYYYFTVGRLGYVDYSMGPEPFYRLTGMTSQVGGNPNGLASIVAITLPFLVFFYGYYKRKAVRIAILASLPLLFITLVLTGSRSGFLAAMIAVMICVLKFKSKVVSVIVVTLLAGVLFFEAGQVYKERYLSMVESDVAGRASAVGRIVHTENALEIFIRRPLFGYGIGTYKEANWNIKGEALVSHNTYTGILVELGIFGFAIYAAFIISFFSNLRKAKERFARAAGSDPYPMVLTNIIETVLITELAFSIFAGNLSYFIFYFLGGFTVVLLRLHRTGNGLNAASERKKRAFAR